MATELETQPSAPGQDTSITGWMSHLGTLDTETPVATPEPVPEPATATLAPAKPTPAPKPEPAMAAPVKPAEPAPEPEAEDRWPRTAQEWKKFKQARSDSEAKLKTERDETKAELAKVKAEIETLRKSGPSPELEKLTKERDELSEQIRILDVQQHPKFKAYFDNRTNAQFDMAKRIVGADKAEQITALLKLPDSSYRDAQLSELTADLSTINQGRLANVINSLSEIDRERAMEISKAKESYDQIQSQKAEHAKGERNKLEQSFESMVKEATEKHPAFQNRDGDEAWNSGVKQRLEGARTLLFGNPGPDMTMKAAMAAVAYPVVVQGYQLQQQEIQKLQAQIKDLTAAQPKVDTNGSPKTGTAQPMKPKPGAGPMDAAQDFMKILHAPME